MRGDPARVKPELNLPPSRDLHRVHSRRRCRQPVNIPTIPPMINSLAQRCAAAPRTNGRSISPGWLAMCKYVASAVSSPSGKRKSPLERQSGGKPNVPDCAEPRARLAAATGSRHRQDSLLRRRALNRSQPLRQEARLHVRVSFRTSRPAGTAKPRQPNPGHEHGYVVTRATGKNTSTDDRQRRVRSGPHMSREATQRAEHDSA